MEQTVQNKRKHRRNAGKRRRPQQDRGARSQKKQRKNWMWE